MGKCCCVPGCSNQYSKYNGLHFYRFPADLNRRNAWIAAISRKDWVPTEYSWVCSSHFISGELEGKLHCL